ncbi:MAG: MFS transporter [Actinophytocola sp.]|nr:MFS transporter [Actinophytocola sp.]
MTVGLWGAALPAINHRLDLGVARTGTVLLATGMGALVCMPVAGRLCDRLTSRRVVAFAGPVAALTLLGPALAPSYLTLLVATGVFGGAIGALDVSMNAHAVRVEQRWPRPVLSAFHGVWSLGGVVGGAMIAAGLHWDADVRYVMAAGALAAALLFRLPTCRLLTAERAKPDVDAADAVGGPLPLRLVIALGAVAFAAFVSEGAAMDWAALHANRVLGADLSSAAFAYILFTGAMTSMRLAGDRVRYRFGPVGTLRRCAVTAVAGYGLVLLAPAVSGGVYVGYAGWFLVGIGLAVVVPVIFAGAGSGEAAGTALSKVTTFGYVGMLAGPSVIGPIGEATSLAVAMVVPATLCAALAVGGPVALRRALARREAGELVS